MLQAAVSSSPTPSVATVMTLLKILLLVLGSIARVPLSYAAPVSTLDDDQPLEPPVADDPSLWAYLGVAAALVLLGGAFAGLTIAYVRDKVSQTP
jgi:metal transporter CNNM